VLGRALAPLLLLVVAAGPARAAPSPQAPDDGPLGVGTPGTFRMLFLEMPLEDARPAGGSGRVDVRWWLANDWSVPTYLRKGRRLVLARQDVQTDVLQLAFTVPWSRLGLGGGFADRWQTTAELRLLEHWGGWTDGLISSWHHFLGTTDFSRPRYPEDRVHLALEEPGGRRVADLRQAGPALSDLYLRTQGTLLQGAPRAGVVPWALALRADLKLPTGRLSSLGGSGGVDAGLGLSTTYAPVPWFTLHALGEVRFISPMARSFALQPAPVQWGADVSAVVRLWGKVAVLVEDRLSSPLFRGGWSLLPGEPDPQATTYYGMFRRYNQVSGGVRFSEVTVFFSEDFTPGGRLAGDRGPSWFYNSDAPDIVVGVAWARRL
jgi:hypothetical protein